MKISNIIKIGLIVSVLVTLVFLVVNGSKSVNNMTFSEQMEYAGIAGVYDDTQSLMPHFIELQKRKNQSKILSIGGGLIVSLIIAMFIAKKMEDNLDPQKKLLSLKEKGILDDEEYEKKVSLIKTNKKRKVDLKGKLEIVSKLESLKEDGLLSQKEFDEKVKQLEKKE